MQCGHCEWRCERDGERYGVCQMYYADQSNADVALGGSGFYKCPDCGHEVIDRISLGRGGDKLDRFGCADNRCPHCGRAIKMLGDVAPTFAERVVCG